MPTPAVYQNPDGTQPFTATSAERETTDLELLFITDRSPETDRKNELPYGESRSRSIAYGSAVVKFVPNLDWKSLEQQSQLAARTREVNLELGEVTELGRFPEFPYDLEKTAGGVKTDPTVLEEHRSNSDRLQAEVQRRLTHSPSKTVSLYVHGFNETFASAAFTAAELCHFFGREHICAFFTWPASSSGGFLRSYISTTEAAQYAVGDLKKTIRLFAKTPGVEHVELLAHSRGPALVLDALRELFIETIAFGEEPAQKLKINNIVLMAPDVDVDVAAAKMEIINSDPDLPTRRATPQLPRFFQGRLTIYASPEDRALGTSQFLFRSTARVGQLSRDMMSERGLTLFEIWGGLDVVLVKEQRTDRFGHSYFVSNPEVSSDIIQLIRYGRKPEEPGRPLKKIAPSVWTFPEHK
jgi:esterase/lipase superfamily enzyme